MSTMNIFQGILLKLERRKRKKEEKRKRLNNREESGCESWDGQQVAWGM